MGNCLVEHLRHACLVPREWLGHGTRPIGPCHQRPDDKSHPAGKFGQQRPKPFTAPPCAAFVNSRANTTYPVLVRSPAAGQGAVVPADPFFGAARRITASRCCPALPCGASNRRLSLNGKIVVPPPFSACAAHGEPWAPSAAALKQKNQAPPKFYRCGSPLTRMATGGNEAAIGAASQPEKRTTP